MFSGGLNDPHDLEGTDMSDLRDAARQALEALEKVKYGLWEEDSREGRALITALKAALEQPYAEQARRVKQETHGRMRIDPVTGDVSIGTPTEQEQEPVAWMVTDKDGRHFIFRINKPVISEGETLAPLYTTPPRRKPLSNEELDRLWREPMSADWEHREFARAVEAAHGIKENT
jgi:hypothetical protein